MSRPSPVQADPVLRREVTAIRRLKKSAASHGKAFLADIVKIGKRLSGVKDRVGHGNWLPWLRRNFDWSGDTAANYINVYELSKSPEFRRLRNLPLEALYLLARRNVSPEARIAIVERVEAGEKITTQHVTDVVQRNAETKETKVSERPKPLTAEDLLALRRRHLIDLIIDVARQLPSDRSIEEARAVVASADAEDKRESFSAAVATLGDLVDELRRALNERLIEAPAPPTLRLVSDKGDSREADKLEGSAR